MTDDRLQELTAIDEQIVEFFQKRRQLWSEIEEQGHEFSTDDKKQLVNNWLEVAADYDLDEELVEKGAKVANALCKRGDE